MRLLKISINSPAVAQTVVQVLARMSSARCATGAYIAIHKMAATYNKTAAGPREAVEEGGGYTTSTSAILKMDSNRCEEMS